MPQMQVTHTHVRNFTEAQMHIEHRIIIVENFNTPLSLMDMSWKQKLNRDPVKFIEIMNQIDLIDIFRIFHPNPKEYTIF
jgi:exonuclease III